MTDELSFLHRYIRVKDDYGFIDIIAMKSYVAGTWHLTSNNWGGETVIVKRSGATLRWSVVSNHNIEGEFRSLKQAATAASESLRSKL